MFFSLMCLFIWSFKWPWVMKADWQPGSLHTYGLSPVWERICVLRLPFSLNLFPHSSYGQTNGLLPYYKENKIYSLLKLERRFWFKEKRNNRENLHECAHEWPVFAWWSRSSHIRDVSIWIFCWLDGFSCGWISAILRGKTYRMSRTRTTFAWTI
jgi:hypothetical protein